MSKLKGLLGNVISLIGILSKNSKMKLYIEPRMYVLVRIELDKTYRVVQGSHALAQYAIDHPQEFAKWNNQYLIFLGIRFPSAIEYWTDNLNELGIPFSVFYEPDIFQKTAIACYTSPEVFKNLPLA